MKTKPDSAKTRSQPRLRVFDARARCEELSFVVLDLSAQGIRIESRDPVEVGRKYSFTLEHDGSPIQVEAQARWCQLDRTIELGRGEFETIYRAGFSLADAFAGATLPETYSDDELT